MESHSSKVVFASITTESVEGRLSAQYSPATPQPTMTTSQAMSCASAAPSHSGCNRSPADSHASSMCEQASAETVVSAGAAPISPANSFLSLIFATYFAAYFSMRSSVRRAAGARLSPTCTSYGAGLRRHAASFGNVTRSMFSQRGVVAGK